MSSASEPVVQPRELPATGTPDADDFRQRFQFATDAAAIGYFFCDLPFGKLNWDDRVREHFWVDRDKDVDIETFYRQLHPEDRERTREAIEQSIADGKHYDIEYRTVSSATGEIKWIRAIGRVAYTPAGTPARFDGITQDITAKKQTEAQLRDSETQLRIFADSIPALAWMADADGWIFWYNQRWYDYTGTTPQQMEGWGWQSVHDQARLPAVVERWTESIQTGKPFSMVFPLRGADGTFRSFLTRIVPVRNQEGVIVRWFGTNTEVDELQRTRDALQATEQRIRVALNNLPILLYTTDRDLRYTWVYRSHDAFPADVLLGHRDDEIAPEIAGELIAFKQSVLDSGVPARRELTFVINGNTEVYDMTAEPLHDADGTVIGLTVAALDITQTRMAEDALRRAEKLAVVGRLAASIAHEINNPLESVTNSLFLIRTSSDPEEVRMLINIAEEELARVSHVVTHSLRFNRQSTAPTLHELSAIADSALTLYSGRLRHAPLRVVRDYRPTQPLLCFEGELRQVFANLIGNAVDATRSGKIYIRIREARGAQPGDSAVRVTLADTGIGIDQKTLPRLFEPFVTTKENTGTGLGLWVTAEILKRHCAKVQIRTSTRPGRSGTVFAITFPRISGGPTPATAIPV